MAKKFTAGKQNGNVYYVLTTIKGKDDKGSGLVGIDLLSGRAINQIIFNDKDPDYEVDDAAGRLFNLKKDEISAYAITEPAEQKADDGKN